MKVNNYHPPLAKGGQEGDFKPNYPDQAFIEIEGQKGDFKGTLRKKSNMRRFYVQYHGTPNLQQLVAEIPWDNK